MFGQENLFNSVTFPHNSYFGRLPGEDFLSLDRPLHAHHQQLQQQQQQHLAYAPPPPPPSSELYVPPSFRTTTTTTTRYDISPSSSMHPTEPYNFRRMSADTQASTDSSNLDQKPSAALDNNVFLPPIHTLANPSEPSPPASLRPASPADSYSPAKSSPPSLSATWHHHHPTHQNLSTFQFPALDGPDSARASRPQLALDHHHHQRAYPSSAAGAGPAAAGGPFAPPTPASSTTYGGNPFSPPQQRISGHPPRVAHRPDDAYEQLMLAPGDMPSNNYSPSVAVRPAPVAPPQQQPSAAPGSMGAPQPGQGPAHMMPPLAATQQRRRGKLPKPVTEFLKKWLLAHTDHPYPTEDEKKWLCSETGLSMSQVSNWMINARRRILAPAAKANAAAAAAAAANGNGAFYNRGGAIRTVSGSNSVPDNNAALPVYLPNAYNLPAPQGGRRGSYSTYSPAGPNGGPRQVPPLSTQYNMLPSPGGQFTPSASSATSSSYGYFPPSAQSAGQGVYPTTGSLGPATFGNGTSEGHQGSPNGTPPADFGASSTFAPPPPQQS